MPDSTPTFTRTLAVPLLAALLLAGVAQGAAANGWEHTSIAFPVLVAALDDGNPGIRRRAAESLGFRQQRGAAEALLARLDKSETVARVRQEIFRALARLGAESALPAVERCLAGETEVAVRIECARVPGNIDTETAETLALQALDDPSPGVRLQAIASLGRFTGARTLRRLTALSTVAETPVREAALLALGQGGAAEAAGVLTDALAQATDQRQAIIALQALTLLGEAGTVDEIRALFSASDDETVRRHALVAMASTRAQGSQAFFLDALASADPASRGLGLAVLREYGDASAVDIVVGRALEDCADLFRHSTERLLRQAPRSIEQLQLLSEYLATVIRLDPAAGIRLYLPAARPRSIPRSSTQALKIADLVYQSRWQALYGLGYTDAAGAGKLLQAALSDADARIRAVAIRSMGVLDHPGFVAPVQLRLADDAAEVRWMAARVLGRSQTADSGALIESLGDDNAQVRLEAALALGYLKAAAAGPALRQLAASDPDARVSEAARYAASLID